MTPREKALKLHQSMIQKKVEKEPMQMKRRPKSKSTSKKKSNLLLVDYQWEKELAKTSGNMPSFLNSNEAMGLDTRPLSPGKIYYCSLHLGHTNNSDIKELYQYRYADQPRVNPGSSVYTLFLGTVGLFARMTIALKESHENGSRMLD